MNTKQKEKRAGRRKKASVALRAYRETAKKTPEQVAAELGWPLAFYLDAEAGRAGLSPGQDADVRALLRKAIEAAGVRDQLRAASRARRIPLIGVPRVVEMGGRRHR